MENFGQVTTLEEIEALIASCAAEVQEGVEGVVYLNGNKASVSVDGHSFDVDQKEFAAVCGGSLERSTRYHILFAKPSHQVELTTTKVAIVANLNGNRAQLEKQGMILGVVGDGVVAGKKSVEGVIRPAEGLDAEFTISRSMKKLSGRGKFTELEPGTEVLFQPQGTAISNGGYIPMELVDTRYSEVDGDMAKSRTIQKKKRKQGDAGVRPSA